MLILILISLIIAFITLCIVLFFLVTGLIRQDRERIGKGLRLLFFSFLVYAGWNLMTLLMLRH